MSYFLTVYTVTTRLAAQACRFPAMRETLPYSYQLKVWCTRGLSPCRNCIPSASPVGCFQEISQRLDWKHSRQYEGRPRCGTKGTRVSCPQPEQLTIVSDSGVFVLSDPA